MPFYSTSHINENKWTLTRLIYQISLHDLAKQHNQIDPFLSLSVVLFVCLFVLVARWKLNYNKHKNKNWFEKGWTRRFNKRFVLIFISFVSNTIDTDIQKKKKVKHVMNMSCALFKFPYIYFIIKGKCLFDYLWPNKINVRIYCISLHCILMWNKRR